MRSKYKNKSKAITLFEILSIISIVVLLSTITLGFIKYNQPNIRLYAATKEIRSYLQSAKEKTISEQKQYGVKFYQEEEKYELVSLEPNEAVVMSRTLPQEISFISIGSFKDNTVIFNKSGAAEENGSIIIKNSRDGQKTIIINPSGYVSEE